MSESNVTSLCRLSSVEYRKRMSDVVSKSRIHADVCFSGTLFVEKWYTYQDTRDYCYWQQYSRMLSSCIKYQNALGVLLLTSEYDVVRSIALSDRRRPPVKSCAPVPACSRGSMVCPWKCQYGNESERRLTVTWNDRWVKCNNIRKEKTMWDKIIKENIKGEKTKWQVEENDPEIQLI